MTSSPLSALQGVARPRPAWLVGALGVLAAGAVLLPASAAATSVGCHGATTRDKGERTAVTYSFRCNETIKAFTIIAGDSLSGFSTTAEVLDRSGAPVNGQSFGCEGPIPGVGFGCSGTATPHEVRGTLALDRSACAGAGAPRVWMIAVDERSRSSEPFALRRFRCSRRSRR